MMKKKIFLSLLVMCMSIYATEQEKKPWYKRMFSGFTSEKVTLSTMNYEQLCEAKNKVLEKKDHFTAIKYLERMSKVCTDLELLRTIVLELAAILFEDGKFSKAYLLYDQYIKNYPGQSADYILAYYKKVLCSFYQVLEIDRDQTMTEQTIELCNTFLTDCKNNEYEKEVQTIIGSCKKKLAQNELYIAQNYIIQNRVVSANRRLAHIRDTYLSIPEIEPELLKIEIALAEKVGNTQFAQAKRIELNEKCSSEQKSMHVAQNKKTQRMVNRF